MRSETIALRGARTAVHRWGDAGPTVVVAHSAGLDGRSAQWFGSRLADMGARVVSIDLRGHGASTAPPEDVTLLQISRDLGDLPDVLGLDRPHLLGTSLGGVVGSMAVREFPGAYASLTVVCSPDRGYPTFVERAVRAEESGMHAVVEDTLARWFTEAQLADHGPAVELARASVESMQVDRWARLWRDFAQFEAHPDLRGISPVLCVAGGCDRSTPPEVMARAAAALGGALEIVDDAPHQALMTHAHELARMWATRHL